MVQNKFIIIFCLSACNLKGSGSLNELKRTVSFNETNERDVQAVQRQMESLINTNSNKEKKYENVAYKEIRSILIAHEGLKNNQSAPLGIVQSKALSFMTKEAPVLVEKSDTQIISVPNYYISRPISAKLRSSSPQKKSVDQPGYMKHTESFTQKNQKQDVKNSTREDRFAFLFQKKKASNTVGGVREIFRL